MAASEIPSQFKAEHIPSLQPNLAPQERGELQLFKTQVAEKNYQGAVEQLSQKIRKLKPEESQWLKKEMDEIFSYCVGKRDWAQLFSIAAALPLKSAWDLIKAEKNCFDIQDNNVLLWHLLFQQAAAQRPPQLALLQEIEQTFVQQASQVDTLLGQERMAQMEKWAKRAFPVVEILSQNGLIQEAQAFLANFSLRYCSFELAAKEVPPQTAVLKETAALVLENIKSFFALPKDQQQKRKEELLISISFVCQTLREERFNGLWQSLILRVIEGQNLEDDAEALFKMLQHESPEKLETLFKDIPPKLLVQRDRTGTTFLHQAIEYAPKVAAYIINKLDVATYFEGYKTRSLLPSFRRSDYPIFVEIQRKKKQEALADLKSNFTLNKLALFSQLPLPEQDCDELIKNLSPQDGLQQKVVQFYLTWKQRGLGLLKERVPYNKVVGLAIMYAADDPALISQLYAHMTDLKKNLKLPAMRHSQRSQLQQAYGILEGLFSQCQDAMIASCFKEKPIPFAKLKPLLAEPFSDDRIAMLFQRMKDKSWVVPDETMGRILARYEALTKQWAQELEVTAPPAYVILSTAQFIETKIFAVDQVAEGVWKRKDTGLKRGLQVWKEGHVVKVAILAKQRLSKLQESGTFKTANSALVTFKNIEMASQYAVRVFTKSHLSPEQVQEVAKEFQELKRLRSLLGAEDLFVAVHAIWEYTFAKKPTLTKLPRASVILEPCIGDGNKLMKNLNFTQEKPQFFPFCASSRRNLTQAIALLHSDGQVHGDLSPANVLYTIDKYGQIRLKVNDLGFRTTIAKEKFADYIKRTGLLKYGYYGSGWWTAPEFIGNKNFIGDFFRVEDFAVGFILYQFLLRKLPPWTLDIDSCMRLRKTLPRQLAKLQGELLQKQDRLKMSSQLWDKKDLEKESQEIETLQKTIGEVEKQVSDMEQLEGQLGAKITAAVKAHVDPTADLLLEKYKQGKPFTEPEAYLLIMTQLLRSESKARWSCQQAFDVYEKLILAGKIVPLADAQYKTILASGDLKKIAESCAVKLVIDTHT